jgi:hypothetical protein
VVLPTPPFWFAQAIVGPSGACSARSHENEFYHCSGRPPSTAMTIVSQGPYQRRIGRVRRRGPTMGLVAGRFT